MVGGRGGAAARERVGAPAARAGYWLPVAEKSTPTHTYLGHGWYLSCSLPAKSTAAVGPGAWVDENGIAFTDPGMANDASQPGEGYYPVEG